MPTLGYKMGERLRRHPKTLLAFSASTLLGMVAAFGLPTPQQESSKLTRTSTIEALALTSLTPISQEEHPYLREERIAKGDTVGSLFSRLGIDDPAAFDFLQQDPAAQVIFRQLAPGKPVSASTTEDGNLLSLHFPLNGRSEVLAIQRNDNRFTTREEQLSTQTALEMKSGEIRLSLFGATDALGIPDAIASQLAEIFSSEIDFYRDLRKGDKFTLIYEMQYQQGQGVRSGRILAAEFVNNGRSYRAVLHANGANKGSYYTPEGKSLRKAFLKSPLEFSRITSGFTNARLHPILQTWRAHKGVDYGAPSGTKVRSTADGVVEFAGKQGGYGNLLVIRHDGRYSTAYGHLSSFSSNIRKGSRVSQGDIIGYVGATGWATGPHLHYEFRINGSQVNPLAVNLPNGAAIDAKQLAAFRSNTGPWVAQLDMLRDSNLNAMSN